MKLIPNWRKGWKMFSVQLAAVMVAWAAMPTDTQAAVLSAIGVGPDQMTGALALLVIIGRFIEQPGTK